MTVPQALQIALQHHQAGRLTEAETLYRQILTVQPNHADALHLLGIVAHQTGRSDLAVEWIRRAITANPAAFGYYVDLGNAFLAQNHLVEAIRWYRRALQIKPDLSAANNNLGHALLEHGQIEEAVAACRRALELKPNFPEAHNNLGNALKAQGKLDGAIEAYRLALQVKPDFPEVHNNLGNALRQRGLFDESIVSHRRALELRPDYPYALNDMGAALKDRGRCDEALAIIRRALELRPAYPEAHNNLGNVLRDLGRIDEAVAAYRYTIQMNADYMEAHNNLGTAFKEQGNLDEAVVAFRRALQLRPDSPDVHNNLGSALKDQGDLDGAIASYRRALQSKPDCVWAHSNLIYTLHFHPDFDDNGIAEEHGRWNRQFSEPLKQFTLPHGNDRSPSRRLKIGYVSPDFYDQSECYFVIPLFEAHTHTSFEIHGYASVRRPDGVTEQLKRSADHWHDVQGESDAALSERIRRDGIDVLVDLTMHMRDNRMPLFCRNPAPVQVSWLAYPGSTGLHSIGYRLTDARLEPLDGRPAWSSEEPIRLPDSWCCYLPVGESPEVSVLPALSSGWITFGSLNNLCKVHAGVLALWARLLETVKKSRLLMRCPEGSARERTRAFFKACGIAEERVEFVGTVARSDYLRLYRRIDLGLDPFPYNGITTTCDALWMGVPVLTLPGATAASRAGVSLLSSVGLEEFAASSEAEYVWIAVECLRDLPRLAKLRAALRERMRASPLMDAPRFARNVEAAYRSMWEHWCSG